MDNVNYFDEYFLGNIDQETLINKISEGIQDRVMYTVGAIDCAKYLYDYYDRCEPIYPSEMANILDEFFKSIKLEEDMRKDIEKERYIKEAIKRLASSVPSQTKVNVDAKHQFEKETNELMNVLVKLDIAATDENGEFRPTSDILKDIAEKWNT